MKDNISLQEIIISPCETFHLYHNLPLYSQRFKQVLKFHAPGLAPVAHVEGAYHINLKGESIYTARYQRTFGFYHGLAAVINNEGWFHIRQDGSTVYTARYLWCGNFQHNTCVVKNHAHHYFHIGLTGERLYQENYAYAGDFRDGIAVVQNFQGNYSHIDLSGALIHDQWFLDLDVFHKGFARAKDSSGWFHIDRAGNPLYVERYIMIEPFYNGLSRVENQYGEILRINEQGNVIETCRQPLQTPFQQLSGDIVGYWKTQTIKAAVDLNVFAYLPAELTELSSAIGLSVDNTKRLLRALYECDLVIQKNDTYECTGKAHYLKADHPQSLYHATKHWANAHYLAWMHLADALRKDKHSYDNVFNLPLFDWLDRDQIRLLEYQQAMNSYAVHDYPNLIKKLKFAENSIVMDAAGGSGALLQHALYQNPLLTGILLERIAVIENINIPNNLSKRMQAYAFDLFRPWPQHADTIILSRVLHDWNDEQSLQILEQAKQALNQNGQIIIIEMLLENNSANGGMLDMNMLVITGGKERTFLEYQHIAQKVGLKFTAKMHYGNYHAMLFHYIGTS
jgi:hypothetical protein